ncbi:MAG: AAA family ATPase [Rickettsiales bacterium]
MTTTPIDKIPELIHQELSLLWAAHHAVGLKGYMCLYSNETQVPFRTKEPGITFWFGPDDTQAVIDKILEHYNDGQLPNTPLLLNPIVHTKNGENYEASGSGIIWCTSLCLGVNTLNEESCQRAWELGIHAGNFHRGDNEEAGLKLVGICDEAQPVLDDGKSVAGNKELYEIADIDSAQYANCYLLSGISYLTNHGLFEHPGIKTLFPKREKGSWEPDELTKDGSIHVQKILDAAYCWNAYERHHSLYQKFGTDPEDVAHNMGFFNLVARDIELFDATGPMRKDADEMFEFIVPGLIPRGSITLLAGAGGSGKSSLAHQLCIMAATDYEAGEEAPHWLGQRLAIEKCKGISIYFSGEDGPPIINARASIYDPQGKARRLMFQRTDFGEGISFKQHLQRLHKIPDVPIMVIDPARKFLTGDEGDSGAVSEFFEAIEEFAIKKNTAVVVVHHLEKGATPSSTREILDMIRGSQVFIDRSRVIIGMFRDGPYTVAGLAKNNIPPNMGMVTEERVFARDAKHLDLVWLPGDKGVRNTNLSPEELKKIIKAARQEKS